MNRRKRWNADRGAFGEQHGAWRGVAAGPITAAALKTAEITPELVQTVSATSGQIGRGSGGCSRTLLCPVVW